MKTSQALRIEKHDASGQFAGLAWAFDSTPDSVGDVLLPSALRRAIAAHTKASTMPVVRVEHRPELEVGRLTTMDVTARGLEVSGQIETTTAAGRTAHSAVKAGQLAALSVGFDGEAEMSGRTRVFTDVALVEVSLTKRPINVGSRIEAVKSWTDVQSVRDLEKLLHATGMPNRLAARVAKSAWPTINTEDQIQPAIFAALNRIASI